MKYSDTIYSKWAKISSRKLPEANIQAEIYNEIKKIGLFPVLEFKIHGCRIDCAVFKEFKEYELIAIIEVKSYKYFQEPNINTKQIKKYRERFDVPLIVIGRIEGIPSLINELIELI